MLYGQLHTRGLMGLWGWPGYFSVAIFIPVFVEGGEEQTSERAADQIYFINERRCSRPPIYGRDLLGVCSLPGREQVPWVQGF